MLRVLVDRDHSGLRRERLCRRLLAAPARVTLFQCQAALNIVSQPSNAARTVRAEVHDEVTVNAAVDRPSASFTIVVLDGRLVAEMVGVEAAAYIAAVTDVVLGVLATRRDVGDDVQQESGLRTSAHAVNVLVLLGPDLGGLELA